MSALDTGDSSVNGWRGWVAQLRRGRFSRNHPAPQLGRFLIVGLSNTVLSFIVYRLLLAVGAWYLLAAPCRVRCRCAERIRLEPPLDVRRARHHSRSSPLRSCAGGGCTLDEPARALFRSRTRDGTSLGLSSRDTSGHALHVRGEPSLDVRKAELTVHGRVRRSQRTTGRTCPESATS
jgi:hypothetical protein